MVYVQADAFLQAGRGGAQLISIGRFDPSSKTCSRCGSVKHGLKLSDRAYRCDAC
ncbi:MAG: zinc ribbon domain-containing protein [Thermoprotei archaeon]